MMPKPKKPVGTLMLAAVEQWLTFAGGEGRASANWAAPRSTKKGREDPHHTRNSRDNGISAEG